MASKNICTCQAPYSDALQEPGSFCAFVPLAPSPVIAVAPFTASPPIGTYTAACA